MVAFLSHLLNYIIELLFSFLLDTCWYTSLLENENAQGVHFKDPRCWWDIELVSCIIFLDQDKRCFVLNFGIYHA